MTSFLAAKTKPQEHSQFFQIVAAGFVRGNLRKVLKEQLAMTCAAMITS
jgi:hypothetical protein